MVIIVPCYNEARRFQPDRYQEFLDSTPGVNLFFVDDGSKDDTANALAAFCRRNPGRADFERLTQNSGKAEAVRQGMLRRLAIPDDDLFAFCDADLAAPLTEIAAMKEVLEKNKALRVVIGSRIRRLGSTIERKPLRHYLGRVFATAASVALGLPVYDTQCGAKVFRRDAAEAVFRGPFISSWLFDVEILFKLKNRSIGGAAHDSIYEYPLSAWSDQNGSTLPISAFFTAPVALYKMYRRYSKPR